MAITNRKFKLLFFIPLLFSQALLAATTAMHGIYDPDKTYPEAYAYAEEIRNNVYGLSLTALGVSISDGGEPLQGHQVCYSVELYSPGHCDIFASYVNNSALMEDDDANPNSCHQVGNPIVPTTGNKFQHEKLIVLNSIHPLVFDLYFNNRRIEKWRHSYSRSLNITTSNQLPKYNFIDTHIDTPIHTVPESPGGFGINQVDNNIPGRFSGQSMKAVKFYSTASEACETGWNNIKSNYRSLWAAGSSSQYNISDGKCRIYANGHLVKTMGIYSRSTGREMKKDSNPYLRFTRQDGTVISFQQQAGEWLNINKSSESVSVVVNASGITEAYLLHTENNEIEKYDLNGRLLSIAHIDGYVQNLFYDDVTGQLLRVENETGEFIAFGYELFNNDQQYRLQTIVDHVGRTWRIRYSNNGNLEYIDNPDTTSRQYLYEDANDSHALTGIIDERALRYSTYGYDDQSRAVLSYHAGNVNYVSVQYNDDGSRIATVHRTSTVEGSVTPIITNYGVMPVSGGTLVADISGPGCASCGSGDVHYEYSADNGYLEFKIEHGIRTEYGNYDTKGNPGFIIQAAGTVDQRRKDYTYDPRFHNKITTITEPSVFAGSQKVTTYTYDDAGHVTSVTIDGFRPDGTAVSRTSNYQYTGPYQQLSQIDGPRTDVNDIIDFEYYANSVSEGNNRARLRNVRGSDGNTLRSNISYTATGKVASEYRSNSLYMGYAYELDTDRLSGMLEYDFSNAYWRITDWTYLPTGEVKTISQAKNTTEEVTLTLDYDAARRLTRITDGLGNYIEYILDSEGNVEKENIYDVTGYLKKTLTQTFDSYDRLDNFTEQNRVENKDYNTDGTLNNTTDGKGVVTDYSYDNLKRLTQVIQDQGGTDTATANALTQYGYDVQDNLISVTDANSGQTSYIYDDLGNLISQTSPDTGITIFTHDEAGNIATQIDAKGQLFSYSYDAYNRLTTKDEPGSDDDVSYVYDACVNGVGRLCEVVRKNSSLRYQYNVMGDVLNVEQSVVTGSVNNYQSDNVITYSYDGVGRVKTITYPSTAVVTYSYDAAGQVSAVTLDKDGVQTLLTQNVIYSPFGPVASQTVGSYVNLTGFYYDDYRPFNLGDSNFYNEIINNYDLNANPLSIVETGEIQNYLYDAHDRLDTSNGVRGDFNYDYDLVGNKTQIIQDGTTTGITYDLSSNRMNNLAGSTVVIDANGNTTQLRGMLLGFTTDNRLKNVNATAFYEYNGLGQRSMKQVTASGSAATHGYVQSVVYLYGLKGELLAETGPTGKVMKEYVYMNDRPLAMLGYTPDSGEYFLNADLDGDGSVNAEDYNIWKVNYYDVGDPLADVNGDGRVRKSDNNLVVACVDVPGSCQSASYSTSIYYIHTDHLGTPRLMSNEAGIAVWKATATPFGKASVNDDVDADGQSVTLNIRQPGQYYDRETGLYYNYYRYYDPETGRYITSDPLGVLPGVAPTPYLPEEVTNPYTLQNTQEILRRGLNHTYAYVENNPLSFIDPFGLLGGVRSNGSRSINSGSGSCSSKCWTSFIKGTGTTAIVGLGLGAASGVLFASSPGWGTAASASIHTGSNYFGVMGYLDVLTCLDSCEEDDGQCKP